MGGDARVQTRCLQVGYFRAFFLANFTKFLLGVVRTQYAGNGHRADHFVVGFWFCIRQLNWFYFSGLNHRFKFLLVL